MLQLALFALFELIPVLKELMLQKDLDVPSPSVSSIFNVDVRYIFHGRKK